MHGVCKVLQQVNVDIKADDKCQVFIAQDLVEKFPANFLLHVEHAHLAAAGIDQNAQGQGKIGFSGEVLDGLRLAVLEDFKVILREIGNQGALLVLDVEEELDHVHVDFQRADRLVFSLGVGLVLVRTGQPGVLFRKGEQGRGQARPDQHTGKRSKNRGFGYHNILSFFLLVYSSRLRCTNGMVSASELQRLFGEAERICGASSDS